MSRRKKPRGTAGRILAAAAAAMLAFGCLASAGCAPSAEAAWAAEASASQQQPASSSAAQDPASSTQASSSSSTSASESGTPSLPTVAEAVSAIQAASAASDTASSGISENPTSSSAVSAPKAVLRAPSASKIKKADPLGRLSPGTTVNNYAYIGSLDQDDMSFSTKYPDSIKYLNTSDTVYDSGGPVGTIVARLSDASAGEWSTVHYSGSESSPVMTLTWRNAGYTSMGERVDVQLVVTDLFMERAGETEKTWQDVIDYRGGRNGGLNFSSYDNSWVKSSEYDGYGTDGFGYANYVQIKSTLKILKSGTTSVADVPSLLTWTDIDQPGYPGTSDAYWNGKNGTVSDWNEAVLLGDGFDGATYVDPGTYLNVTTGITQSSSTWSKARDALGSSTWTRFAATKAVNDESNHDQVKLGALSTYLMHGKGTYLWRGFGCSTGMFQKMTAPISPSNVGIAVGKTPATQTVERGSTASFDVSTQTAENNTDGIIPYTYSGLTSNAYKSITFSDALDAALDASKATVSVYRTDVLNGSAEKDDTSNWTVSTSGQTVTATCKDPASAGGKYRVHIEAPVRTDANLDSYELRTGTASGDVRVVPNQAKLTLTDQFAANPEVYSTGTVEVLVPRHEVSVAKTDAADGTALQGAVFGLYSDAACSKLAGKAETDSDGTATWTEYAVNGTARTYLVSGAKMYVKEISAPSGYKLDGTVHTVTVGGSAKASVADTRIPAVWSPTGTKTFEDADGTKMPLDKGRFTFRIQEVGEDGGDVGDPVTAVNDADGKIAFPSISFESAGTHRYRVSEVAGDDGAVVYDDEVYDVVVTVAPDADNTLAATATCTKSDGTETDCISFDNRMREYVMPKTGANGAASAAGIGAAMAAAAALAVRRKTRS